MDTTTSRGSGPPSFHDTAVNGPAPRARRPETEAIGVGRRFIGRLRDGDVTGLAAEMAYRFLFAVFPFGLFVAALGAFVAILLRIDNPAGQIIGGLGDNLPPAIAQALQPELQRLMSTPRTDLLSIGALAALWAATGGTNALIKGMHRAYGIAESRSFLLRYAVAIGLTALAALGVIASFVTIVGSALLTQELAGRIGFGPVAWQLLQLLRWPVVFVALVAAVAILYRYAPNVVVPWRWILVGALLFTAGWLAATAVLGLYVANFANYGATYGSLGAVIVLMLWFYLTALLLVVGAELTAALAHERTPHLIRRRVEEEEAARVVDRAADRTRRGVEDVGRGATS